MFLSQAALLCLPLIVSAAVTERWPAPDPLEVVKLVAPDGSARANFIARGATLTNFWVKDNTNYLTDNLGHPYFGPVVGRYANRIKNGTFSIPISAHTPPSGPNVYHTPENENNGTDTLHGGTDGFDRRTWTIAKKSQSSVTFTLLDPAGMQGFPGDVYTEVVYTLEPNSTWTITMHATADKRTPIMLSGHHYWNLEAYEETQDLSGHYAQFNASRIIGANDQLIPNGTLLDVAETPADFQTAKSLGEAINATVAGQYCGAGCVGFDNCWVYDNNTSKSPIFSLWSVNSGIRMDVITDQPALQVYTCDGIYNASLPIPRKADQGGPSSFYEDHSCLVVEQESWIDAINNPSFGIDQVYGPGRDYHWESSYIFSTV
ncbi:galactose mutarotase-like protein [Neolentinus lepideus HHB14362 ss-1]|uniref:Galactose mutarotase-like protein n=1 Tax=Neolentinus lepideus HHB14362 ss-1 TaxID=1314782 RepID=A0A165N7K1_9AGAM|nr:galactose mutarotase-like protein [Neolentinus lepideus HHB14362 ss-1]